MARAAPPDWDAIKRDYRTGQFSLRELGRLHSVSESTIRTKRDNQTKSGNGGWAQDLAGAVRAAVDDHLVRDAAAGAAQHAQQSAHAQPAFAHAHASQAGPPAPPPSDATIVAAAAQRGADVVRGHRAAAGRLKEQFDRLSRLVDCKLVQLEIDLECVLALEQADQVAALEGQPHGGALRRDVQGFGLMDAAELLDTMARSLGRLTAVERLAFNLDGKPGATPVGLEEGRGVLTAEQRTTALANLRARTLTAPALPASQARH